MESLMSAVVHISGALRYLTKSMRNKSGSQQELDVYFDEKFADGLENWGINHAWPEISFLLSARSGVALDLACGSGPAYDYLKKNERLEYHGCDISDALITRAVRRGIDPNNLRVMDATKLDYPDRMFDYVFSIGSLEHFTESGLVGAISEAKRVCRGINFHMVPVSASGFNEGWITTVQSYWNNSERWWLDRFAPTFGNRIWIMNSKWADRISRGVWLICVSE
jgi:ubiquinone/menaquinone biosynthesis C-methylase UbiE